MLRILTCLQTQHDWRLVLLAACVCLFASFAAINMYQRACADRTIPRPFWIGAAGLVTGCGIWATHFIAALAFSPGFNYSFDPLFTVISLIVAIAVVTAGFAAAAWGNNVWARLGGGAIIGLAVAAMHFLGMASMKMPADVVWMPDLVIASIVVGMAFGALSLMVANRTDGHIYVVGSAALLFLAVVSHHFTAIAAMGLIPQALPLKNLSSVSPVALSVSVASVTAAIVVASLVSSILDRRTRRSVMDRNILLDAAINNIVQGLCMFGPDNRLQVWNERYVSMYNIAPGKVHVGCSPEDLFAARTEAGTILKNLDAYAADLKASLQRGQGATRIVELVDGRTICVAFQLMENGGWVSTHEDITERRKSEARAEYLTRHDPLTGLANRAAFNEYAVKVCGDAAQQERSFTILSIDIDGFSEVNDTYSHAVGDLFLCEVARRLQSASDGAFVSRLGGDEFVIVSSEGEQPARAGDICTRVLAAFEAPFAVDGNVIHSGCTVGVSIFPQDGADLETLVTNADLALHRAKMDGRGSVRFFEQEMDKQIREKRALLRDLDLAIGAGQLEVYYQPQTEADGKLFGFEALVRWKHPVRGLVSPGAFIPLAEETGLIGAIDEWILREACRQAAEWPNPLSISINVSPVSFKHGDLPSLLHAILLETGLNPKRLEIEITEGVLVDDFARASSMLRRIKNLGVRVAMDDFGTGYSSLSYLQSFPFDKIKIDQAFVAQINKNVQSSAIIRAIIGLGQTLGLSVIAEGVETEQQRLFLAAAGCREMQGYLLGRPQPIAYYADAIGRAESSSATVLAS